MSSDNILQLLLRSLPAIVVFLLGFLAANDVKTRKQWANFLYSVGQLRADQREDTKKQATVKWPFFLFAVLLLWLPFTYYKLATRTFEVGQESDLFKNKKSTETAPAATPTPVPTSSGPTPPPPPLAPGETAPAASPAASAPVPNAPAVAKTPAPNVSGAGPRL